MEKLINPFSINDKIENKYVVHQGSSFSLLSVPVTELKSWENPDWMDEQLDQHENQINLDTDGKDKC